MNFVTNFQLRDLTPEKPSIKNEIRDLRILFDDIVWIKKNRKSTALRPAQEGFFEQPVKSGFGGYI